MNIISKLIIISGLFSVTTTAMSAINSKANFNANQIVNLNLEVSENKKMAKSDLVLPFYQTGEVQKSLGDKSYLIELSPKSGSKENEVFVEMRLKQAKTNVVLMKKSIQAKLNESTSFRVNGLLIKLRPELI